mgnify:CR=1 FL=1
MTKKSIIIKAAYHKEILKLSQAFSLPIGRLVEEMIIYFKKTGINPKDAINENPSAMVKALDKRIVSFMKVQERDILKPMRVDIYNYQKTIIESFDAIIESLNESNNSNGKLANESNALVNKELKILIEIAMHLDPKGKSGLQQKIKSLL